MKKQSVNRNRELLCETLSDESVRTALRSYDSVKELSRHPLGDLAAVKARHQTAGYSNTSAGRGLALREALYAAIETLRPHSGSPERGEKRWRPYLILTEQFIRGRTPDWIATDLNISRRTFYNEQEQAIGKVVEVLSRWEDQTRLEHGEVATLSPAGSITTTPMANPIPFLAPPQPPHTLIGRDSLFNEIKSWLLNGHTVALGAFHGLPGVGKTALAIELAHDHDIQARFKEGVLWVGLGRHPDILASLGGWAMALNVPMERLARCTTVAAYARLLHTTIGLCHMLLVIDDAWQLDDALAFKVGGPNCAYLVTTRLASIAMDFAGERTTTVRELSIADGLSLLAQLAPQVVEAEPEAALALVRAVGCLPLALILMGGYLRRQSYAGQTRRLQQALLVLQEAETRLKLTQPKPPLEQPPNSTSAEWLSLQASISLSDGALDGVTRQALRDLALFPPKPNTFSEEAALTATAVPAVVLDTLVDYGLVEYVGKDRYTLHQTIADYARAQGAPQVRYGLHDLVQRYAVEQLGTDPIAVQRFVNYFVQYAIEHATVYDLLDRELNNLLASLKLAHDIHLQVALIQGIKILYPFLMDRGLRVIAEQHLEKAFQAAQAVNDVAGQATILHNLGTVALQRGQYAGAERHFQESLALARTNHLRQIEADSLRSLGRVARYEADYAKARTYFEQAVSIFQDIGDRESEGLALQGLGIVLEQYDYDSATACYKQALGIAQATGDQHTECYALNSLGFIKSAQGDYPVATTYYEQALLIQRAIGRRVSEAMILDNLGHVAQCQGHYEQAKTYFEQALSITWETDERRGTNLVLIHLGSLLVDLGDYAGAKTCLEQALDISREIGPPQKVAEPLAWLARIALAQGDLTQAQSYVTDILDHFATTLAGTEEPVRIYLTCYQVLHANHDPCAVDILTTGYRFLQEHMTRISNEAALRSFLENVPSHRELLAEWSKYNAS